MAVATKQWSEGRAQEILEARLSTKKSYYRFEKNKKYSITTGGIFYTGELDLLGHRHSGREVYFEIKHTQNHDSWKKFRQQALRYTCAFPWKKITCVYITPTLTRRYKPTIKELENFISEQHQERRSWTK